MTIILFHLFFFFLGLISLFFKIKSRISGAWMINSIKMDQVRIGNDAQVLKGKAAFIQLRPS